MQSNKLRDERRER